jgi:hypothetical protein
VVDTQRLLHFQQPCKHNDPAARQASLHELVHHLGVVGAMSSISSPRPSSAASFRSVIHNSELHANLLGEDATSDEEPKKPFQRWVSTLRRRKRQQTVPLVTSRSERWCLDDFDPAVLPPRSPHARSDSGTSSIGIIAGVKSATVTLASVSIAPLSRRASKWRRTHNRSSILSASDPRPSVDTQRSILDEAGKLRSRKRREKLEELIRTEESYVADLKALSNVSMVPIVCDPFADNSGLFYATRPPSSHLYPAVRSPCSPSHDRQDVVPPRRAAGCPLPRRSFCRVRPTDRKRLSAWTSEKASAYKVAQCGHSARTPRCDLAEARNAGHCCPTVATIAQHKPQR